MNRAIRLSAIAAACVFCAFMSAEEVKADEILLTSDNDILIQSTETITNEEAFIKEDVIADNNVTEGSGCIICEDSIRSGAVLDNGLRSSGRDEILLIDDSVQAGRGSVGEILTDILIEETPRSQSDELIVIQGSGAQGNSQTGTQTGAQANVKTRNAAAKTGVQTGTTTSATTGAQTGTATGEITGIQTRAQTDTKTDTQSGVQKNTQEESNRTSYVAVTDTMKRMLTAINKRRERAGVGRLTFSDELNRIAALRVNEITRSFSHTRANGKGWVSILAENNVPHDVAGENLACRMSSPEQVVAAWSSSPSHNRCMLNGDYTKAGIGTVTVNGCTYWTLTLTD